MRRIIFLVCIGLLAHGAQHFCRKQTDGFTLLRIQPTHPLAGLSPPVTEEVRAILSQPFSYYSHGTEAFVFLSADGQYVIKFFKDSADFPPAWTTKIPLLNLFKPFRHKKLQEHQFKKNQNLQGYTLAWENLRAETALVYLHLSTEAPPTPLPFLHLQDKLHITHTLDLNKTFFVLQKKIDPFYSQLKKWLAAGEKKKAEKACASLVQLALKKASLKVEDEDAKLDINFGIWNEESMQLDPGAYKKCPGVEKERAVFFILSQLEETFQAEYPAFVQGVKEYAFSLL